MRTFVLALLMAGLSVPACAEQPPANPNPNIRVFDLPGEGRLSSTEAAAEIRVA